MERNDRQVKRVPSLAVNLREWVIQRMDQLSNKFDQFKTNYDEKIKNFSIEFTESLLKKTAAQD